MTKKNPFSEFERSLAMATTCDLKAKVDVASRELDRRSARLATRQEEEDPDPRQSEDRAREVLFQLASQTDDPELASALLNYDSSHHPSD